MNQQCSGLQDFCYFVTSKILFLILMVQEDRKRFVVELTESLCSYNNSLCSFNRTYFWIAVIGNDGDFLPIPSIFLDPESDLNFDRLAGRTGSIYDLAFFIINFESLAINAFVTLLPEGYS